MKKIIIALLLVLASFSAANSQSIRIGEGNVYYVGGDSNYFKFSKQGFFPFGLKTFGTSTFNGSGLFNSANLTVANGILGVTGTGYIAIGGTNITSIFSSLSGRNTFTGRQTMDSLLIGSGLLLWKNGQIFSSSSLNVNSITTSSDTTADLVVTHTADFTGATITGFNAVKISVDTITAPDETVNIYGGLNILSGGYPIFGRTENQNITFSRHNTNGDLLGLQMTSTGTLITYYDSSANSTTALKVGEGVITANDSALATRNWVLNNTLKTSIANNFTATQTFATIKLDSIRNVGSVNITSDSNNVIIKTGFGALIQNGQFYLQFSDDTMPDNFTINNIKTETGGTLSATTDMYMIIVVNGGTYKIPLYEY